MNKAIVIFFFILSPLLFAQSMQTFQEIVDKIKNRAALDIGGISNPFEAKEPKEQTTTTKSTLEKKSSPYELLAIFANRAKVNGKWIKVGDMIDGQKVVAIGKNSIVLDGKNRQKLYLKGVKGVSIQAH
jgi:predicted MPP superfamily phosphohydrolase